MSPDPFPPVETNAPPFVDSADAVAARIRDLQRRDRGAVFLRYLEPDQPPVELTYAAMLEHAAPWAELYDRSGVPEGGGVLLMLENPRQAFLGMVGAMLTRRVPSIIAHPSPKIALSEFSAMLLGLIDNAHPHLLVGDRKSAPLVSQAIGQRVASPDDLRPVGDAVWTRPWSTHAPIFLQYSSGTTGAKKGVAITRDALLWQVDTYAKAIGLGPADRMVSWLPLYHDMGLITALMMPLLTGTPVTLMSPFAWIGRPVLLLRAISDYRATLAWLPNFAYSVLARSIADSDLRGLDLRSLRGLVNCSEPVLAATHDQFLRRFTPLGFRPSALATSFAMAENTFAVTSGGFDGGLATTRVDLAAAGRDGPVPEGTQVLVSSGRPLPGVELRILDPAGRPLGDRCVGEIAIRSASLMSGYHRQEAKTREAFRDGRFLTGDLGFLENGELYVTGRKKDLIILAGRNLYPQDVEAIVNDVPDVIPGRCVALGVPDALLGTESLVVIAESHLPSGPCRRTLETRISEAIARRLDLAPREVRVVDHLWLVKSTSGKLSRNRNRERYLALKQESREAVPTPDAQTASGLVARCVAEVTGRPAPGPNESLITSGLIDSLGLVNLLVALETTLGRPLPSPATAGFEAFDTIAGIEALVASEAAPAAPRAPSITDRQIKASYYLASPRDSDLLILGSSRTYALSTATAARFGYRAFHLAVNAAKAEDLFCLLAMVSQHHRASIRRILLGIDPEIVRPRFPIDVRLLECPELMQYLEPADRAGLGRLPHELNGTNASYRDGNLKRYELRYREWGRTGTVFDPRTGDLLRFDDPEWQTREPADIDPRRAVDPETVLLVGAMDDLDPARLAYLERFIDLAQHLGVRLDLYVNPLHPDLEKVLAERSRYLETQQALVAWLEPRLSPQVRLHDFRQPQSFGGRVGDFYHDGRHLGCHNADLLMGRLLDPSSEGASGGSRASSPNENQPLAIPSPDPLEHLCAERPLRTSESFPGNDFYGLAAVVKRYCGMPAEAPLPGILPHGAKVASRLWQEELDHPLSHLLLWSEQQRRIYAPATAKPIQVIGSPYLYAARLIEPELTALRRQARGTLVFPTHSTHHLTAQYDEQALIAHVAALPKSFRPVTLCLYWRDVQLGRHLPWIHAGFPCVSAGHVFDPEFPFRLWRLISTHRFALANRVGTAPLAAAVAGLPVLMFSQESRYSGSDPRYTAELAPALDLPVSRGFYESAALPLDQAHEIQRRLAQEAFGVDAVREPAELRRLLESLATQPPEPPPARRAAPPAKKLPRQAISPEAWAALSRGLDHLNTGRPVEALSELDLALQLHPTETRLAYGRAVALARAGRRDDARTALAALASRDSGFAKARQLLVELAIGDA